VGGAEMIVMSDFSKRPDKKRLPTPECAWNV
jgi:hypothetical protein